MKHGKLTWKLGIAAIAALGLSVMPAHISVPGVGTVQAYAAVALSTANIEITGNGISAGSDGGYTADYTGEAIAPTVAVTLTGEIPNTSNDYEVTWTDPDGGDVNDPGTGIVDAGKYTATISVKSGSQIFTEGGTVTKTLEIKPVDLSKADVDVANKTINWQKYADITTGTALSTAVGNVTVGDISGISSGLEFSVKGSSSTWKPGKQTIVIKPASGNNNFIGAAEVDITVRKITLAKENITVNPATFTGNVLEPASVTVEYDGKVLTPGTDYTWALDPNQTYKEADTYTDAVIVYGVTNGAYTTADGGAKQDFVINPATTAPTVTLSPASATYDAEKTYDSSIVTVKLGTVTLDNSLFDIKWDMTKPDGTAGDTDMETFANPGSYKLKINNKSGGKTNISESVLNRISSTFTIKGASLKNVKLENFSSYAWFTNSNVEFEDLKVTLDGDDITDDVEISYSPDHKSAGTASVIIEPKDSAPGYVDSYTAKYTIVKPAFSTMGTVTLANTEKTFTGGEIKLTAADVKSIVIHASGLEDMVFDTTSELNNVFDFTGSTYKNNVDAGTASVALVANDTNIYGTGGKTVSFKIVPADLSEVGAIAPIDESNYTGDAIKPAITVTATTSQAEDNSIKEGTDYTVAYSDNINAGTATVTVTGKGNYTGTKTESFTINKATITAGTIKISAVADQAYTGSEIKPTGLTITNRSTGKTYTEGTDYTLSYSNNIKVSDTLPTVTITGAGNYKEEEWGTVGFKIVAAEIGKDAVVDTIAAQIYTGSAIKPVKVVQTVGESKVELLEGADYTVEYKDNTEVGTASYTVTGIENYTGTVTGTFQIGKDFSAATVAAIKAVTYTGKAQKPAVTVTLGDATLKEGTDYTVAYSNNTNAGKATVTITPAGSYAGDAKTVNFTINKAKVNAKVTKITGKNAVGAGKTITLKATLNPAKSNANQTVNTKVTWKSNKTAIAKVDKNGKVTGVSAGKAKITVKAAGGSKSQIVTVYGITSKNLKQTVKAGKTKNVSANDTIKSAKSSNTKVATVTYKGKKVVIKGVKKGTAKVTVTTKNGGKNVITVTVK